MANEFELQEFIAEIQLTTSERISVLDLHIKLTYGNLLAGRPDRDFNERLLTRLAQSAENPSQYDTHTFVLRPPAVLVNDQLPAFYMTALLDSPTPKDAEYDGSKLRVVWFVEQIPANSIQHIQDTMQHLDWRAHARDYRI